MPSGNAGAQTTRQTREEESHFEWRDRGEWLIKACRKRRSSVRPCRLFLFSRRRCGVSVGKRACVGVLCILCSCIQEKEAVEFFNESEK